MATLQGMSIGNLESADDIKKVSDYLYRLNDQLRYMFDNLTPEDNFNEKAYLIYKEEGEKVAKLELSVDGITAEVYDAQGHSRITQTANAITAEVTRATGAEGTLSSRITQNAGQIALKVNSSDLGNSSLTIKPAKIELQTSGQLVISSGNFTLDSSGNASFKGSVQSGSTVSGSSISGGSANIGCFYANNSYASIGEYEVYNSSDETSRLVSTMTDFRGDPLVALDCYEASGWGGSFRGALYLRDEDPQRDEFGVSSIRGSDAYFPYLGTSQYNSNNIYAGEFYDRNSWWDGWSLTRTVQMLWEEVFPD